MLQKYHNYIMGDQEYKNKIMNKQQKYKEASERIFNGTAKHEDYILVQRLQDEWKKDWSIK